MSRFLGQSSVEYLTTYGWMLLAVSIVGGTVYTQIQPGCRLTTQDFSPPFPTIGELYQQENGTLLLEVRNPSEDAITINDINIKDNGTTLAEIEINKELRGEESALINTNRFSRSETCEKNTLTIDYEKASLDNLTSKGKIQGFLEIVSLIADFDYTPDFPEVGETVTFNASPTENETKIDTYSWEFGDGTTATGKVVDHSYSTEGAYNVKLTVNDTKGVTSTEVKQIIVGDLIYSDQEISVIGFYNTLATDCLGDECANQTGTGKPKINTSQDSTQFTLFSRALLKQKSFFCITDRSSFNGSGGCDAYLGGSTEILSEKNYNMTGSLETPSIKPENSKLCIGECSKNQ